MESMVDDTKMIAECFDCRIKVEGAWLIEGFKERHKGHYLVIGVWEGEGEEK